MLQFNGVLNSCETEDIIFFLKKLNYYTSVTPDGKMPYGKISIDINIESLGLFRELEYMLGSFGSISSHKYTFK